MRHRAWIHAAVIGITVAACGSDSTGTEGEAVIVGSVESSGQAPAPQGESGPQMQSAAEASTVILGEVSGSGTFQAIAEVDVDAEGRFRFEEVPAGRSNLVIRAQGEGEAVVGSVVLKETTSAGVTHRVHPIGGRSTLHAEVWIEGRSRGGAGGSMGAAELALFLDASADAAAGASTAEIEALAQASVEAQEAMSAALTAHGVNLSATARNEVLASAAADRDADRDMGTGESVSQQNYISAAFDAYVEGGLEAEALAMAYAAAATTFARASAGLSATTHLEVTREALLLNIDARERAAAAIETDPIALRGSTVLTLNALESRVRSAADMVELEGELDEERALIEDRFAASVIASLPVLGGTVEALVESRTRSAVNASMLWVEFDGATSANAMGTAVGDCSAATAAAVADLISAVPASAGTVSAENATSLLLILGAGASLDS